MSSTYILRKGKSSLRDLKDGSAALNYGVGANRVFYVDCNCGSEACRSGRGRTRGDGHSWRGAAGHWRRWWPGCGSSALAVDAMD